MKCSINYLVLHGKLGDLPILYCQQFCLLPEEEKQQAFLHKAAYVKPSQVQGNSINLTQNTIALWVSVLLIAPSASCRRGTYFWLRPKVSKMRFTTGGLGHFIATSDTVHTHLCGRSNPHSRILLVCPVTGRCFSLTCGLQAIMFPSPRQKVAHAPIIIIPQVSVKNQLSSTIKNRHITRQKPE